MAYDIAANDSCFGCPQVFVDKVEAMLSRLAADKAEVLQELGLPAYRFRPKEAIAIMNGTAVMNAGVAETLGQGFSFYDFLEDDRPLDRDLRKTWNVSGTASSRYKVPSVSPGFSHCPSTPGWSSPLSLLSAPCNATITPWR
jgi:hypothetical protein